MGYLSRFLQMLCVSYLFVYLLVCWGPPPLKGGKSPPGPSPAGCHGCDLSSDRLSAAPGPDTNKSWARFSGNACVTANSISLATIHNHIKSSLWNLNNHEQMIQSCEDWEVWLKLKQESGWKTGNFAGCFPNPCHLYINSKRACHVCDSSRHTFKLIMREPMSWKYTVYSLWVLTKCPERIKTNTPAFWQDTTQQHTSPYRRLGCHYILYEDIKIHSSKHINTCKMCTHMNYCKQYVGGNEQTSW